MASKWSHNDAIAATRSSSSAFFLRRVADLGIIKTRRELP
jgi:hypothetical protein